MIFKALMLAVCLGAMYQASKGTTSFSAKVGMYFLISCSLLLIIL